MRSKGQPIEQSQNGNNHAQNVHHFNQSLCALVIVWAKIEVWVKVYFYTTPLKVVALALDTFAPSQRQFDQGFLVLRLSQRLQGMCGCDLQILEIPVLVASQLLHGRK